MQEDLCKGFLMLDCMGVDVKVFRNIEKLVELDVVIIRLKKVHTPAGQHMRKLFKN